MNAEKLDLCEKHSRVASHHPGRMLFLSHLAPAAAARGVVLYVHGGTFPSALAVAHRFDGRSWRDELCNAGFQVWALDFHGFGRFSDPYPEMELPAESMEPPMIRASFKRRSRSSEANGTECAPIETRAGCSTHSPPPGSGATSRSAAQRI